MSHCACVRLHVEQLLTEDVELLAGDICKAQATHTQR